MEPGSRYPEQMVGPRAPALRLWEVGPGRGCKDPFPFFDHRTMAEAMGDAAPALEWRP